MDIIKKMNKEDGMKMNLKQLAIYSKMEENLSLLRKHKIPESYPEEIGNFGDLLFEGMIVFKLRDEFIKNGSFSLVSMNWVRCLADYLKDKKCIELMAGSGILSYGLKSLGIDVIATDDESYGDYFYNKWTNIEKIDALDAIRKYIKERPYIILSWPEMGSKAYEILMLMRELNKDAKMIYIGEVGAACADDAFADAINIIDADWVREINEKYQSWAGMKDLLLLVH